MTISPDVVGIDISKSKLDVFDAAIGRAERIENASAPIAALAERWGFCDAAYLGRAFRETYGMTPGDYHAMHAADPLA